jgi:hypothetical protein
MPYKHRWTEPRDRGTRAEYRALRRELKNSRTLKARRLEIETRLDAIATTKPESILSELPPPKPTTKDLLALCDRVDVAKRKGSLPESIPSAGTPAGLEAFLAKMVGDGREGAIRRAKAAPDSERAFALLAELPDHRLSVLARELAAYLWQQDLSRPRPDAEQIARGIARNWLNRAPHNRADIRGDVETVANAVADVYRLLAERDAAEPDWYLRRAGKLFDASGLDTAKPPAAEPDTSPVSVNPPVYPGQEYFHAHNENIRDTEKRWSPETYSGISLDAQVNLILQIDPPLARLAAHSPEFDSGIRASLTRQLQAHGFADGTFLRNLYNAMRPRALSAFPPRTF